MGIHPVPGHQRSPPPKNKFLNGDGSCRSTWNHSHVAFANDTTRVKRRDRVSLTRHARQGTDPKRVTDEKGEATGVADVQQRRGS